MTGIARIKHVSTTTIYRVLKEYYKPLPQKKKTLPTVLCFDEFKSVRESSGAMSFVVMDGQTKHLLDIVENRKLDSLKQYFYSYDKEARKSTMQVFKEVLEITSEKCLTIGGTKIGLTP